MLAGPQFSVGRRLTIFRSQPCTTLVRSMRGPLRLASRRPGPPAQLRAAPGAFASPLVARHIPQFANRRSAECRIVIHPLDEVLQVSYEVVDSLLKPGAWADSTL